MKNSRFCRKICYSLLIEVILAAILSLFCLKLHFDISLFAFPVAAGFTGVFAYFVFFRLFKKKDGSCFRVVLKLSQYLPYVFFAVFILQRAGKTGTLFFVDVVSVILWFAIFFLHLYIEFYTTEKKMFLFKDYFDVEVPEKIKKSGIKYIFSEIIDWIDSIVQIVFFITVFQVFVFQLYEIPSESMVPQFLVKDRVFVNKFSCGPKFPMTDVGLPVMHKWKRGDIVVFRNPHYTIDRKSEVKSVTNQMLYMLTFMQVNLNKDENGEMKADPLVKRVCGLPGEQLVMQDGVLYSRTKNSDDFKPIPAGEDFADWNLNEMPKKTRSLVRHIPLSQSEYEKMLAMEDERRNTDLNVTALQCELLAQKIKSFASINKDVKFKEPSLFNYDLFKSFYETAFQVLSTEEGQKWFSDFVVSWIPEKNQVRDIYEESNFRLNALTKLTYAELIERSAELIKSGINLTEWNKDEEFMKIMSRAEDLCWYVQNILDMRNMPVFPANDKDGNAVYIPKDCYFMMGDNRFNSLDLRHRYDYKLENLTSFDELSIKYYSCMEPQYLNRKYMIGKPEYLFWPLWRHRKL